MPVKPVFRQSMYHLMTAEHGSRQDWSALTKPMPGDIGSICGRLVRQANLRLWSGQRIPWGANNLPLYDFGPDAENGIFSKQPPDIADPEGYTVLVPAVDADGNETAGLRAPMVEAPLATYNGWNLRDRGYGFGAMHEFTGSTIPFPDTPEERHATGDPRPSVQERYKTADDYVKAIMKAAKQLAADGFILEEDLERIERDAQNWYAPRHDVKL